MKVTLNESALASLTEKAYMMAVKIGSAEGELKGSEERGVGYLIVTTENKLVKDISSKDEVTGTLLTDYTGWNVKYDSGVDITASELFDGDLTNVLVSVPTVMTAKPRLSSWIWAAISL